MRGKKYLPIILSIIILLVGVVLIITMYTNWKNEDIVVSNPAIQLMEEKNNEEIDLKSIIYEAEKSDVQIEGHSEEHTSTGSGFLYNNSGDIITNAHVIEDVDAIYVRTSDAKYYPAAVVGISDEVDIALIRVPQMANRDVLPISKNVADIGDEIIALGSPHGFQNTVTLGIISGDERDLEVDGFHYSNLYQISAQITHGNSGGPLIHRDTGEIIGINSVGTDDGSIGFSIPINEVIDTVTEWSNKAVTDQLYFANMTDVVNTEDTEVALADAIYLTEYFWDSVAMRDYVSAYSTLSNALQRDISYSDFRNTYTSIADIKYDEPTSEVKDNSEFRTIVNVTLKERENLDEDLVEKEKNFQFTFSFENDQLKITQIRENEA